MRMKPVHPMAGIVKTAVGLQERKAKEIIHGW